MGKELAEKAEFNMKKYNFLLAYLINYYYTRICLP